MIVTVFSVLIALPLGAGTAIYIGEIAPRKVNEILKPTIEILAGIPRGWDFWHFGALALHARDLQPAHRPDCLHRAFLLALISIPTIVSIAEDALYAVPNTYRDAAYALGASNGR